MKEASRYMPVDVVRGLCITIMLFGNLSGSKFHAVHPLWARLMCSFAAPAFVALSGLMVALTMQSKGRKLSYFLIRGGLIMWTGALVDLLIWKDYPFLSVDVLYLIGLGIPASALLLRTTSKIQYSSILFVFVLTPVIQNALGYRELPSQQNLEGLFSNVMVQPIWRDWIVDGWFPIFPWIGYSFFGACFASWLLKPTKDKNINHNLKRILVSISIIFVGSLLWYTFPGEPVIRQGYSEMIYPDTFGHSITSIGVLYFSLIIASTFNYRLFSPFILLGQCPLFIYILHLCFIEFVPATYLSCNNLTGFLVRFLSLFIIAVTVAWGVSKIKAKFPKLPKPIRFILGS